MVASLSLFRVIWWSHCTSGPVRVSDLRSENAIRKKQVMELASCRVHRSQLSREFNEVLVTYTTTAVGSRGVPICHENNAAHDVCTRERVGQTRAGSRDFG